jgi:hypothetical protein
VVSCSILTITVDSNNKMTGERTRSLLHVIDLAGSERLNHSHAVSHVARCTNTQNIPHQSLCWSTGNTFTASSSRYTAVDGRARCDMTVQAGERLKEAQYVNKSLSSLGQVFMALQSGAGHVPYRNSKLTHFLKDSLGECDARCRVRGEMVCNRRRGREEGK